MKKSGLGILILLFLQYACGQIMSLTYLPHEVVQWTDRIELLLKNSFIKWQGSKSSGAQCPNNKTYTEYTLTGIATQLHNIWDELQKPETTYKRRVNTLQSIMSFELNRIHDKISVIERSFKNLIDKLPNDRKWDILNICSYANSQLRGDNLRDAIESMRDEIISEGNLKSNFDMAIVKAYQVKSGDLCDAGHAMMQEMYSIYSKIVSTEIRGYITTIFSYHFLYQYNGTVDGCKYEYSRMPAEEISPIHNEFKDAMIKYAEKCIPIMKNLLSDFRACAAKTWERGSTFIEFQGAMQAVAMPSPYYGHCWEIDSIGVDPKNYCEQDPDDYKCISLPRPCLGHIYGCKSWNHRVSICLAEFPAARRYEWISSPDFEQYDACYPEYEYFISYSFLELYWDCFCKCIDNQPDSWSTHVVNLQSVEADINRNMVVTGIRFRENHKVLHLQIQQGILASGWRVENVTWKEINDISEEVYAKRVNKKIRGKQPNVTENIDYRVIAEDEALCLDDIRVPHGHVLTGIKFHYGLDKRLKIATISRECNPTTGRIETTGAPIIQSVEGPRDIQMNKRGQAPLSPDAKSINATYVVFQESDWRFDSGQTTLPLFDAIPIVSDPPNPLGGVGVFYKTIEVGRVIALKLFSLDYSPYIKNSLDILKDKTG